MSSASWRTDLHQALAQATPPDRPTRVAVVGIGHELRGDDAVGLDVARRLQSRSGQNSPDTWLVCVGGSAPENCTSILRRFRPDLVVLVDAADLHTRPGTIQWLDWSKIAGVSASTHTLPLDVLATYLAGEIGAAVGVVAIQPATDDIGARLTPVVQRAARRAAHALSSIRTHPR
jgi:hydrogenase maturation protease HycI